MAVTGTITITTLLFFYIAVRSWRWPLWLTVPSAAFLLTVDLLFLAANLTKLIHGAWLPLLIGLLVFTVLTTWQRGRELVTLRRQQDEGPLQEFIDSLHGRRPAVHRVPGIAVFLNRGKETAPLALRANVDHNHVLHRHVLILSIETVPVPHVPEGERVGLDNLGHKDDRITFVAARFGYMDRQNVPALLPLIRKAGLVHPLGRDEPSYFLSTIDLSIGKAPGLNRWRKRLFLATSQITADAAEYFQLPRDSTVIMGSRIEL
jgi:KUP system potassium uptake protein